MAAICPQCGREMERGRLTAGGFQVRWVPESGHALFHRVVVSRFSLSPRGVPAYICRACRKVTADY